MYLCFIEALVQISGLLVAAYRKRVVPDQKGKKKQSERPRYDHG